MDVEQIVGTGGVEHVAERFGLSPDQARTALGSLMPAVLGGLQKKAANGDLDAVGGLAAAAGPPDAAAGNQILGHIFGSKDVSRQVADHAAGQSGLSASLMKAMLPVVAAMVAGRLGGGGGMLGQILSGGEAPQAGGGGIGGLLGGLLGGAGGGGNPLDNILAGFGRR